jgi:hypothetical protein
MAADYFAEFHPVPGGMVRHDTRVYLSDGHRDQKGGTPVGAVVGKNPGSAGTARSAVWGPVSLLNDQLLPNVRSIFLKAHEEAVKTRGVQQFPPDAYVQVLNLSYFCTPDLAELTAQLGKGRTFPICSREGRKFSLLWYLWGNPDRALTSLKTRFKSRKEPAKFFYSTATRNIIVGTPSDTQKARHTQGMTHDWIVPYLATLL